MPNLVQRPLARFVSKIGSCAKCMRQSLEAAIVAWILFAFTVIYYPGTSLQFVIEMMAAAVSLLWLLHLATYAGRALNKSHVMGEQAVGTVDANALPNELERRRVIGVLLRAAAIGAAISLPMILRPTAALAFCGQCSKNSDCGVSPCRCVNTAGPGLPVCNECKCN